MIGNSDVAGLDCSDNIGKREHQLPLCRSYDFTQFHQQNSVCIADRFFDSMLDYQKKLVLSAGNAYYRFRSKSLIPAYA